jgi:hypothetical protein
MEVRARESTERMLSILAHYLVFNGWQVGLKTAQQEVVRQEGRVSEEGKLQAPDISFGGTDRGLGEVLDIYLFNIESPTDGIRPGG